ncbi:MAG: hypothetical protein F6K19_22565 [Cyanothece sp. SIO1E1]|nr:hypothetical protein [Cyanothece sp. SIO1E1]
MAMLKPTFSIRIGALQSSSDAPMGGPTWIAIDRDMDAPADGLCLHLMTRAGIAVGEDVTVELGYEGDHEGVFTGTVVALQPAIAGVKVQALGQLNALLNLRTAAVYENQTAGQIARDVIAQAGLTAGQIETGPTLPTYAIDQRLSALAHLRQLADRLGYELYGDREGKVMFQALGAAANLDSGGLGAIASGAGLLGGATEGYVFGQHLLAARATQHPAPWNKITVGGESPMSRQGDTKAHWLTTKDTDHQGVAGQGTPQQLIIDPVARTQDLADRFAAGYRATGDRRMHQVRIKILGRPQVELGDTVQASDVADELINGSGYVRALRHRFGSTVGFTTELTFARGDGA